MLASFQVECRKWRQQRKMSQLDLALAADISQKHLSYLETGRSQPSREMVLRLSDAMQIPLKDRNQLLRTAGYSAAYTERHLDEAVMQPIRDAINIMLKQNEPYPAFAVDREWNLLQQNQAADGFYQMLVEIHPPILEVLQHQPLNIMKLTLHPDGLRPFISNWQEIAIMMRQRLEQEMLASTNEQDHLRLSGLIQHLKREGIPSQSMDEQVLPVVPLNIKIGDTELSFFSVISTFGTPQDITTDEIRIESFYPMDEKTKSFFEGKETTN